MKKITDFINGKIIYDKEGQDLWIKNKGGGIQRLADLRGWGAIQNLFKMKNGLIDLEAATKFQDEIGEWIATALNEKIEHN